jgi:hypothetical protein
MIEESRRVAAEGGSSPCAQEGRGSNRGPEVPFHGIGGGGRRFVDCTDTATSSEYAATATVWRKLGAA